MYERPPAIPPRGPDQPTLLIMALAAGLCLFACVALILALGLTGL